MREAEAAREAALKEKRRAQRAKKWLERVEALASVAVLFLLLSSVKTWVPPLTDRAIVVVVVIVGVLVLISAEERR